MALTTEEIEKFADFAADNNDRENATAYYAVAQNDMKGHGWRVTQRAKDIIWARLCYLESVASMIGYGTPRMDGEGW